MGAGLINRINLLPWRERRREDKRREFTCLLLGVVILAAVSVFFQSRFLRSGMEIQASRNEFLRAEIGLFDARLAEIDSLRRKKRDILVRMNVIADLQGTRPLVVHVFDALATALPDGVYFNSMKRSGNEIAIAGVGDSYAGITELVRSLDASPWFRNADLRDIAAESAQPGPLAESFSFALNLTLADTGRMRAEQGP